MRYVLILMSLLYINCGINDVIKLNNTIEIMIDIYVNGFGFNKNHNF